MCTPTYSLCLRALIDKKGNTHFNFLLLHCRNTKHSDGESKAASGLGEVYLQMAEYDKAMEYHQLDYDLSEAHQDIEGKVSFEIKILKGVQNWPHRPTSGLGSNAANSIIGNISLIKKVNHEIAQKGTTKNSNFVFLELVGMFWFHGDFGLY